MSAEARAAWDAECRRANGERCCPNLPAQRTTAAAAETTRAWSLVSCPQCHKHVVETTTLQTRSADEPMTEFYWCTACDYRWRG